MGAAGLAWFGFGLVLQPVSVTHAPIWVSIPRVSDPLHFIVAFATIRGKATYLLSHLI